MFHYRLEMLIFFYNVDDVMLFVYVILIFGKLLRVYESSLHKLNELTEFDNPTSKCM